MRGRMLVISVGLVLIGASAAGATDSFYIRGGGDGHGIGMSQWGAYGYALHGKSYRFILAHYYEGTTIGSTDPRQLVRVLISTGSATFSGASHAGATKLDPTVTYSVRALSGGKLGLYSASGKKLATSAAPLRVSGSRPLSADGKGTYRGALEFRADGRGVETVNAVDLEDYVRGVVSAEMPANWSAQALEAQAIAARTYAITTSVSGNGYQLYSDTRSQMYQGVAAETPATNAAVTATHDQIVTYGGHPVVTYFFASSGGHTENIENVWLGSAPQPWLRGVADPYDGVASNPDHRWVIKLSTRQAAARLKGLVKGKFVGIKVTAWGVSPRVVNAQVTGTRGSTEVSGPQLQEIFGLMSTYMSFAKISSSPGSPRSSGGSNQTGGAAPGGSQLPAHSRLAVAAAGFVALPLPPPLIEGSVFPARGGSVAVQLEVRGHWRTIAHVRLGRTGAYAMRLRHGGFYRVVWAGLDGPAITVR
jgi:stage II sporulation protein D